jgi:hypothetical protein
MKTSYVYCIFRLDRKFYKRINKDLISRGYKHVKAIVPTISVLKKSRKGKNEYEDVPLLFNYGFIRMKSDKAFDRYYLNKIKRDIPGILSFMKSLDHKPKRKRLRIDNAEDFDDYSVVATISRDEVIRYKHMAKANKIYSVDDITRVGIGDYVILRGYPFEGIPAILLESNLNTKKMLVKLYPETDGNLEIEVPMENVLYSAYHESDEYKLYSTDFEKDISQIPDGSTEELLMNRQY